MSILDLIRSRCAEVAQRAQFVRIDHGRLPGYAESLPLEQVRRPEVDPHCHYLDHGDETVAFFLTLDAVNFGSGYFPHLKKRPGMSGYFTVASSLNDHFKTHGPLSAPKLARLTAGDCAGIFGQDLHHHPVDELMQLFAAALNDLGGYLQSQFHGSFSELVDTAGGSAEELVRILSRMSFFNDRQTYEGLDVPFFKRAQLTAADLALAFAGQGYGAFDDLDQLTIFADNLVPHVLRIDGILTYDPNLVDRIEREELIRPGSPEEIEIRACAVHVVELIKALLGREYTAMQLDYLLWNRGQDPFYKKGKPRHRTRTVFY